MTTQTIVFGIAMLLVLNVTTGFLVVTLATARLEGNPYFRMNRDKVNRNIRKYPPWKYNAFVLVSYSLWFIYLWCWRKELADPTHVRKGK